MNKIFWILAYFAIFFFSSYQILNVARVEPVHVDETDWILDTAFYDYVFLDKTPSNPNRWTTAQALSHPSLTKYIYGLYLHRVQPNFSKSRTQLYHDFGEKFAGTEEEVALFSPHVMKLRYLTSAITISTLLLLFILINSLTQSKIAGGILVILLSQNNLFVYTMTRATWDCIYVFFMTLAFVLYLYYIKTQNIIHLIIAGIASGATVISKLTGSIFHMGYTIFSTLSLVQFSKHRKQIALQWLTMMTLTFIVWSHFSIFFLHISPTSSIKLIGIQADINKGLNHKRPESFKSYTRRLEVLYCLTIQPSCLQRSDRQFLYKASATRFPIINLGVLFMGIFFCIHKIQQSKSLEHLYVLTIGLTSIATMFTLINVPWDRYYLPVIYFIAIFQALGFWYVYDSAKKVYLQKTYKSFTLMQK